MALKNFGRTTLYYNPNQGGIKNIFFKFNNEFYRTGKVVNKLSDLNTEYHRESLRRIIARIMNGDLNKMRVVNKGLQYAGTSLIIKP